MNTRTYQRGEKLELTLLVTVDSQGTATHNGIPYRDLTFTIDPGNGRTDRQTLTLPLDAPDMTIRRAIPADGEPKAREIWADNRGEQYYALADGDLVDEWGRRQHWTHIHGAFGPITRIHPKAVQDGDQ